MGYTSMQEVTPRISDAYTFSQSLNISDNTYVNRTKFRKYLSESFHVTDFSHSSINICRDTHCPVPRKLVTEHITHTIQFPGNLSLSAL
jgi:hypothetical protein